MGWFDGDSSDDDNEESEITNGKRSNPAALMMMTMETPFTSSTATTTTTTAAATMTSQPNKTDDTDLNKADGEQEEEEDPLDAYMKSLGNPPPPTRSTNYDDDPSSSTHHTKKPHKMARLDEENEEEATSHWTTTNASGCGDSAAATTTTSTQSNNNNNNNVHNTNDGNILQSQEKWETTTIARTALDSTFHKAGSSSSSIMNSNVDITLTPVQHETMNYATIKKRLMNDDISFGNNDNNNNKNYNYNTTAGHAWRQQHQVTCHPPIDPILEEDLLSVSSSSTLTSNGEGNNLYRSIVPESFPRWCQKQSYTSLTPVQAQTLPVSIHGYNGIITAATGSGKTLGYLWPLVLHLYHNDASTKGLILTPTRELTQQIEKTANSLGRAVLPLEHSQKASLAITGGGGGGDSASNKGRYYLSQTLYHSNPRILVATPGRLLDVLRALPKKQKQGTTAFTLQDVTFLVLDEADKLLQMGFSNQVIQVLQQIRPDRQCLMTSATMGHRMEQVAMKWMGTSSSSTSLSSSSSSKNNLVRISVGTTGRASEHVEQHVVVLPNTHAKEQFVLQLLPSLVAVGRTLIFVATRDGCEQLATTLRNQIADRSLVLETLHGDKHQSDRNAALQAFKKGRILVLIATDVAGRGLDIPNVTTVLNFDPAKNLDTHVHRVGRAGRLSKEHDGQACAGTAYTLLLSPSQADFARILKSAQEREGRPVSPELAQLAQQSSSRGGGGGGGGGGGASSRDTTHYHRHSSNNQHSTNSNTGNNSNRKTKSGRWGLGFSQEQRPTESTTNHSTAASSSSSSSYYGPSSSSGSAEPPAKKRSRWGS